MKRITNYFLLLSITFFCFQKAYSQTSEIQAQALFIYNFTRFIEWPAGSRTSEFVIGVYGSQSMFSELKNYTENKKVGSQSIIIKKINSIDEITGIHMLFVAFGKTKDLPAIVNKISDSKTIIISEKSGAIELGSTINFVLIDDNKLKYETKTSNAAKAGLKFNSTLETMAIAKH